MFDESGEKGVGDWSGVVSELVPCGWVKNATSRMPTIIILITRTDREKRNSVGKLPADQSLAPLGIKVVLYYCISL